MLPRCSQQYYPRTERLRDVDGEPFVRRDGTRVGLRDETVRTDWDWSAVTPSEAVIDTLSMVRNRGPLETDPLYDAIDPDALNAMFRTRGSERAENGVTVSFTSNGLRIVVRDTGEVRVTPQGAERKGGDGQGVR